MHTSALQPTSQYKSLVIAEETTSDELLGLLLSTYNSIEPIEQFSLYEVGGHERSERFSAEINPRLFLFHLLSRFVPGRSTNGNCTPMIYRSGRCSSAPKKENRVTSLSAGIQIIHAADNYCLRSMRRGIFQRPVARASPVQ